MAESQPELIAHHWERVENVEKALEWRLRAADRARALSAPWEVVAHYRRALEHLERIPDTPERRRRHFESVIALFDARPSGSSLWNNDEEMNHVAKQLDDALETATDLGDLAAIARLENFKGDQWGDKALLDRAMGLAERSGDKAIQAEVSENLAGYNGQQGHYEEALVHAGRAIDLYASVGAKLEEASVLAGVGRCYCSRVGRLDDALDLAKRARDIAMTTGDLMLQSWMAMEAEPHVYRGHWSETVEAAEESLPATSRKRDGTVNVCA